MEETSENLSIKFAEERLRLEREALAVERERIAASRARFESESKFARGTSPAVIAAVVVLLGLVCFAGGLLTGFAVMENRQEQRRTARLAKALSQLEEFTAADASEITTKTNGFYKAKILDGNHKNVSFVVVQ